MNNVIIANKLVWSKKAMKQITKLPQKAANDIYESVEGLKGFPDCKNVKKLKKHKHEYRLRVGQYRVLFDYTVAIKVVAIEEVRKRDDRTYH